MHQFLLIATAHFLALLSPGPDFFLIARTSLAAGWCVASGACVGIALANGVFIVIAFAGIAVLQMDSILFVILQLAGCGYLIYLGVLFIRHAGGSKLGMSPDVSAMAPDFAIAAWCRAALMGFISGILNPKNMLFYASLASLLSGPQSSTGWRIVYGIWMFSMVLLWDFWVAVLIGNRMVLQRFAVVLPWLERVSGVLLILLALIVLGAFLLPT